MDVEKFIKATGEIDSVNVPRRTVTAIISTPSKDRENDVVLPKGMRVKQYAGTTNLFNHNPQLPIGRTEWLKAEPDRVIGRYHVTDSTEMGRDVFNLLKEGVLNGHSMSFNSFNLRAPNADEIKETPELSGVRYLHHDWEPYEFGPVSIPANPDAVTMSVCKSVAPATLVALGWVTVDGQPLTKSDEDVALNHDAVSEARRMIAEHKVDREGAWSYTAEDGNKALGPDGDDWAAYAACHLAEDRSQKPRTKKRFKYPIIKDGNVFLHGLRAAEGRAAAQGDTAIAQAAKELYDLATGAGTPVKLYEAEKAAGGKVRLNRAGVSESTALIRSGKVDKGSWSFDAADGNAILGPDGDDWGAYSAAHLGVDDAEPKNTRGHWKYPVVKRGRVNIRGLRAAEQRASQYGATEIADAAKRLYESASERQKSASYFVSELAKRVESKFGT